MLKKPLPAAVLFIVLFADFSFRFGGTAIAHAEPGEGECRRQAQKAAEGFIGVQIVEGLVSGILDVVTGVIVGTLTGNLEKGVKHGADGVASITGPRKSRYDRAFERCIRKRRSVLLRRQAALEKIEKYKKEVRDDPNNSMAYRFLGDAYCDIEKHDQALTAYREALRIDPKNAVAHNNLGVVYVSLERYPEAAGEFEEALRLVPGYVPPRKNLKVVYRKLARLGKTSQGPTALQRLDLPRGREPETPGPGSLVIGQILEESRNTPPIPSETLGQVQIVPGLAESTTMPHLRTGVGLLLGSSNYVVADYRLVGDSKSITAKFVTGEKTAARVVIKDRSNGIVFFELEQAPAGERIPIVLGDSSAMRMGDRVFAVGYSADSVGRPEYSEGVIDSLFGAGGDPRTLQINFAAGPASGPLFNDRLQLIGLAMPAEKTKAPSSGGVSQNVVFAVKSAFIENLLSLLPETPVAPAGETAVFQAENMRVNFVERMKNNIVLLEVEN